MGRTPWFDVDGMRKGDWTGEEDQKLVAYITEHGIADWGSLPKRAGLQRCGKSCRLRWLNYLKPGIKRGKFTPHEEEEIIKLHAELGNRWAAIAKQMHNRTDNDIKNHWNSCLKKRLAKLGIDPKTHGPKILTVDVTSPSSTASSQTLSSSSSVSPSSSSTSSAHFLNKLAAGISSHGSLEKIKTVILSERPRETVDEEEKMMMDMKDDEVIACFLEIEENLNTTLFDDENLNETSAFSELRYDNSTAATTTAFDDYSSNALYGFDFHDETEQFGDMFLL